MTFSYIIPSPNAAFRSTEAPNVSYREFYWIKSNILDRTCLILIRIWIENYVIVSKYPFGELAKENDPHYWKHL